MRNCPRRVLRKPLFQPRLKAINGPFFQPGNGICVKDMGNAFGIGGPLAGPRAVHAFIDEGVPNFVFVRFTQKTQFNAACSLPYGMTVTADGAGLTIMQVLEQEEDTLLRLQVTPNIDPGEEVIWTYTEGDPACIQEDGTLSVDDPGVGDQGPLTADNNLVLEGELILLETGGVNIMLLEDDVDQSSGIQLETAS